MKLTPGQASLLAAIRHALANSGTVANHQAIDKDGWFFPIDLFLGAGTTCAQLHRKGILERREAGWLGKRWVYRLAQAPLDRSSEVT